MLARELPVAGVPMTLSGWSFTLADLVPWSQRQLVLISALMALFEGALLALLYRDWRLWLIHILTLAFAVAAMIATMKLLAIPLNLLNVLAFRLVLAVGVDYGIYVMLVWQTARDLHHDVAGVIKPVILAGLTAVAGFGSLGLANNPTLAGLGIACGIGIGWSLWRRYFSLCRQRRRLNRSFGAKNLCRPTSNELIMRSLPAFRIAFAIAALAFVSSAFAEPLAPAELKSLLEQIRQKRAAAPQVQADFREEKTMKMMSKPVASSGKVWFQAPNKFRREMKGNAPSVTVSNGQQLWIHYPKFQSAEQYALGKRSPLDAGIAAITASLNLQGVEDSYNITGAKEGNEYVLQLAPAPRRSRRCCSSSPFG
jgi:outer membrane lipoprotein-sorting protein/Na+-translocating ferredoxin:NAD+ oxidoreductase RnfA subunit